MVAPAQESGEFTDFRDAIAIEAMSSILRSETAIAGFARSTDEKFPLSRLVAIMAYDIADEMLEAREA